MKLKVDLSFLNKYNVHEKVTADKPRCINLPKSICIDAVAVPLFSTQSLEMIAAMC